MTKIKPVLGASANNFYANSARIKNLILTEVMVSI